MKTIISLPVIGLILFFTACSPKQPVPEKPVITTSVPDSLNKKLITARIFVKPEKVAEFVQAARPLIDSSSAEPGCESYMLYQNPYDKTKFIFVEIWKDQVAIDNHFSMSYFKAFGPKTSNWLLQPTELRIFNVVLNE
jgi:quinol monooxygenase YgiN